MDAEPDVARMAKTALRRELGRRDRVWAASYTWDRLAPSFEPVLGRGADGGA